MQLLVRKCAFSEKLKIVSIQNMKLKEIGAHFAQKKMACYLYSYTTIHKKYVGYQKFPYENDHFYLVNKSAK